MLRAVSLVEQWRRIVASLPESWAEARLVLTVSHESDAARAAALLGPANPGRLGTTIRLFCARRGAEPGPETIRRLLARLDAEGIAGDLELVSADEAETTPATSGPTLAGAWDAELAAMPADWTDLWAELKLDSTDYLDRAALLIGPLNPALFGDQPGFRFRVARRFGYGAPPNLVRRCLERLDGEPITGELRIVRVLSDTDPVGTQGPVLYVGGKTL